MCRQVYSNTIIRKQLCVNCDFVWSKSQILVSAPPYTVKTSAFTAHRKLYVRTYACIWWCAWCCAHAMSVLASPHPLLHNYTYSSTSETSCVSMHGECLKYRSQHHYTGCHTNTIRVHLKLLCAHAVMCVVVVPNDESHHHTQYVTNTLTTLRKLYIIL